MHEFFSYCSIPSVDHAVNLRSPTEKMLKFLIETMPKEIVAGASKNYLQLIVNLIQLEFLE